MAIVPVAVATADPEPEIDPGEPQAMSDAELGTLIEELSEPTGDFPSDNFVSNETSYLHVASALMAEPLRGRAYVGVGPEQNYSYLALMQPSISYIVDVRRQNMLQHLVLRAAAERAKGRSEFLERWTSRPSGCCGAEGAANASIEVLANALARCERSDDVMNREVTRTLELIKRLGVTQQPGDEEAIRKIVEAFAKDGLDIAYSMKDSSRKYPTLREILVSEDDEGKQRSFLSDEESFSRVRSLLRANRVVPVVGNFAGKQALRGVAADMRKRGIVLGVLYASNVEQYLFESGQYESFVSNVTTFPMDGSSSVVRVWFDQGRRHPKQHEGHRTASLLMPIEPFLARNAARPFATYWHVTAFVADSR